ncbi:MAG: MerR family transcriptional regulator [Lachnospiraceae bacterium]
MKNYYKISEISQLYGIGPDSLRYYERLGILKPKRDTNKYRLYSLKDIYKLNLIRDLRNLGFSMAQIKDYLDNQTIDNTLDILYKESSFLKCQLQELKEKEELIKDRINTLTSSRNIESGYIRIKSLARRLFVRENAYITQDEEMDLIIKKLLSKHEKKIHNFGNQTIGAFLSEKDLLNGIPNRYDSVFFILDKETEEYDGEFPAGTYLSYYYRGSYEQNADCLKEITDYMRLHNMTAIGNSFELFEIDNRDTMKEDEFLTEIQIPVQLGC